MSSRTMCWPLPRSLLAMVLLFRRSGIGVEHCAFKYIGKLEQWFLPEFCLEDIRLAWPGVGL